MAARSVIRVEARSPAVTRRMTGYGDDQVVEDEAAGVRDARRGVELQQRHAEDDRGSMSGERNSVRAAPRNGARQRQRRRCPEDGGTNARSPPRPGSPQRLQKLGTRNLGVPVSSALRREARVIRRGEGRDQDHGDRREENA
jgi:hypothetical protein